MWFRGVSAVARPVGVKTVYDLSATPFFLAGSGYREGTLLVINHYGDEVLKVFEIDS